MNTQELLVAIDAKLDRCLAATANFHSASTAYHKEARRAITVGRRVGVAGLGRGSRDRRQALNLDLRPAPGH